MQSGMDLKQFFVKKDKRFWGDKIMKLSETEQNIEKIVFYFYFKNQIVTNDSGYKYV